MAWTTPKTDWATGDLVAASNLNEIGDNFNALMTRLENGASSSIDRSTNYSTGSATWLDVDATEGNFKHTITTSGGNVLVGFTGTFGYGSGTSRIMGLDLNIDGSRYAGDDGIVSHRFESDVNTVSFTALITGLSAGEHIFKLQWAVLASSTTFTLYAGAGTSNYDVHPQFWVQEM